MLSTLQTKQSSKAQRELLLNEQRQQIKAYLGELEYERIKDKLATFEEAQRGTYTDLKSARSGLGQTKKTSLSQTFRDILKED